MSEQLPPQVTEKAQIVITYTFPANNHVMRFANVKKAEKEYEKLRKAWVGSGRAPEKTLIHYIAGDMFTSIIDVKYISTLSFVDHAKKNKFIPA